MIIGPYTVGDGSFLKVKAYTDNEKLNTPLLWLGLEFPKEALKPAKSCVTIKEDIVFFDERKAWLCFAIPVFVFAPAKQMLCMWIMGKRSKSFWMPVPTVTIQMQDG